MFTESLIRHLVARHAGQSIFFSGADPQVPPSAPPEPIHLYIHIPFCIQLCPYCSFHRFLFHETAARRYFAALRREIRLYAGLGFAFSSVYVGGGTPTVLMDELEETLSLINELFRPVEVSVETNPDRLEEGVLKKLKDLGVQRVSVGVQSFCDEILRSVNRYGKYGSGEDLARKIVACRGVVETLNVDMIYDFPIQDEPMLRKDLETILCVRPDQVTFYPLMVSRSTRSRMREVMGRPSRDRSRRYHDIIASSLEKDYTPNSAWCYSRAGSTMIDEYVVGGVEYVGAGSGAIGFVNGTAYANTFSLERYEEELKRGVLPIAHHRMFSLKERARYHLLMGLFGLRMDGEDFRHRFGTTYWGVLGPEIVFFALLGGIRIGKGFLELTRRGRYYWVLMMREFFTAVDNFRDQSRAALAPSGCGHLPCGDVPS